MKLACPHCGRTLQFSGDCPSFCAYCGQPLPGPSLTRTTDFQELPDDATRTQSGAAAAVPESVPETVGNYRLLRPLGSGGMGSVYEAEDRASGRRVAVKLVSAGHRVSEETLTRFRQEGRLASAIAHPRCVFVLAADEEAGRPYIVMELMPGATLNDLVDKEGPLPVEDAVGKILDVIEGLQEAHRLGVIHRDVKPSNCFVAEDGRVKVGDFGLAKSLSGNAHLTKTGSFLGTPLFASPEQVRNDPLNEQTDVYSVAATLYFLLTGRAPFQGSDATATLARIVADRVPPLQTLRPEIPAALDRVVLKGLERNRERRHRNLEELRRALAPFRADRSSRAGLGLRVGAYALDWLIFTLLTSFIYICFALDADVTRGRAAVIDLGNLFLYGLYFLATEWAFGRSLGKSLTRLRVASVHGRQPPGLARFLLRTTIFLTLINLVGRVQELAPVFGFHFPSLVTNPKPFSLYAAIYLALWLFGWAVLFAPMRPRNGYRGFHEWLSNTRVVRLPDPKPRRVLRARLPDAAPPDLVHPPELPERIGSFTVRGALCWSAAARVLVGEDPALERPVWVWLRPLEAGPLNPVRHAIDRGTRLRWLAGGKDATWQWDAFLAPAGTSLANLVRADGSLTWTEVRPLFEELADELVAADQEGTVPEPLTVDQVWIQPTGKVQLLDMRMTEGLAPPNPGGAKSSARTYALLHDFAALSLEGQPRSAGDEDAPVRAPLPEHAAQLLARLRGGQEPFANLEQVQAALRDTGNRPTELTRSRRLQHFVAAALVHAILLTLAVTLLWFVIDDDLDRWSETAFLASLMVVAVAWAFLTRGGVSLPFSKTVLVNAAGAKASRGCCAWRAALLWVPLVALTGLLEVMLKAGPPPWLAWAAPWLTDWISLPVLVALVLLYVGSTFWSPARAFHDRLAGTFLVPR